MIYKIDSLNYASSGEKRGMVNVDYSSQISVNALLRTEDAGISGVVEEGGISSIQVQGNYISDNDVQEIVKNRSFIFDRDMYTLSGRLNFLNYVSENHSPDDIAGRVCPLYDARDVMFKSPMNKVNSENAVLPLTTRKVDIYAPEISQDPLGFCNFEDRTILMSRGNTNGPRYIDTSFRDSRDLVKTRSSQYTIRIGEKRRNEYSYPTLQSLQAETYQEYISSLGSPVGEKFYDGFYRIFDQDTNNIGVSCSNVLDIEQSHETLDFRSGDVYGTSNPVKATYDGTYTTTGKNTDLSSAREYVGVMESGGNVYLKFRDDVGYSGGTSEKDGNTTVVDPDSQIPMYKYQKIERYNPSKVTRVARHKSNLFSIRVINSGISMERNEEYGQLSAIRNDIENAIRQIVDNITPVNTQLFKVYFEDDQQ